MVKQDSGWRGCARVLTHGTRTPPATPRAWTRASGSGTNDLRDIARYLDASRPWWRRERAARFRRALLRRVGQAAYMAALGAGTAYVILEWARG